MVIRLGLVLSAVLLGVWPARAGSDLAVLFEPRPENQCTEISPLIEFAGAPEATVTLDVRMVDLDLPKYPHGGGVVPYTGQKSIPPGALDRFKGPCPPQGTNHNYRITVRALDEAGAELARGSQTLPCCAQYGMTQPQPRE